MVARIPALLSLASSACSLEEQGRPATGPVPPAPAPPGGYLGTVHRSPRRHHRWAHERARAVAAAGKLIFLRFAHEMNGDWYPWGGAKNGNDASNKTDRRFDTSPNALGAFTALGQDPYFR